MYRKQKFVNKKEWSGKISNIYKSLLGEVLETPTMKRTAAWKMKVLRTVLKFRQSVPYHN